MICPECLNEHKFEEVLLDEESFDVLIGFSCNCSELSWFTEAECKELGIWTGELSERVRMLRLNALRKKLEEERRAFRVYQRALEQNKEKLRRYLFELSNS